jgi:hypothetical protein
MSFAFTVVGSLFYYGFLIATVVVHVAFAVAVRLEATGKSDGVVLVSPRVWAIGTLVGGPVIALVYCVVHTPPFRTTVAPPPEIDAAQNG